MAEKNNVRSHFDTLLAEKAVCKLNTYGEKQGARQTLSANSKSVQFTKLKLSFSKAESCSLIINIVFVAEIEKQQHRKKTKFF